MGLIRTRGERGSALLITVIIVLIVFGIGGAFIVETLRRSQAQFASLKADETLMTCDAGLEKVRLALYQYRSCAEGGGPTPWSWNDILLYCSTLAVDRAQIRADFRARQNSALFQNYRSLMMQNTAGLNARLSPNNPANPAMPASPTNWSPGDADAGVMLGGNMPYLDGAFWIHVRDNDDEATLVPPQPNDPLVDRDRRVVVTVVSTLPDGTQRQIEAVVLYDAVPMSFMGLGAVVSNADVETTGSITVDGRDYDLAGEPVRDDPDTLLINERAGVVGVLTDEDITMKGNSKVGGTNVAPQGSELQGLTTNEGYLFPTGFPPGPDEALGLKPGTLKSEAMKRNTYFTSQAQYDAYLELNGGVMPGEQIIYLEASGTMTSFNVSKNNAPMNVKPSILIVHNATSDSEIKNVHGNFKGLLMADIVTHVNAGTDILGSVMAFSQTATHQFGNGNADIRFSSAVLANLPRAVDGAVRVLSWRRIP